LTMTAIPASAASGQHPCGGVSVVECVVDLDEVESLGADPLEQSFVVVIAGGAHADVADPSGFLQLAHRREQLVGPAEIVRHHEVDRVGAEPYERAFEVLACGPLRPAARRAVVPAELGREEVALALSQARADHLLGTSVVSRRVHDGAALLDELGDHGAEGRARVRRLTAVAVRPEAHDGQELARGRHGPPTHLGDLADGTGRDGTGRRECETTEHGQADRRAP